MALPLPDARQLPDDVLAALRVRAIRGIELGFRECDLAELLGIAPGTICRWWTAYQEGGLDAVPHARTGRPVGVGRSLSDEQAARVRAQIDTHTPGQLGIPAALWTRKAIRALILRETGVAMPARTVGEYLKRWGYTRKKPTRKAKKQDPEEVRAWLEETYPALEQRAKEEDAEILWGDETGVVADQARQKGYARRGEEAVLEVPDPHIRVSQISAISNEGKVRFMTYTKTMNGALFLTFLDLLVKSSRRKVFLIVDRLRAHATPAVTAWVAEHSDRIEVFYLPRRAPQLNPDEYLNNDLKAAVSDLGLPDNQDDLRGRVVSFMCGLFELPGRVMNYFLHSRVLYASGD
jgi:transposase